jgi:hypothetical protein
MSSQTLTCRSEQWGIHKCDLPPTPQLLPLIPSSILPSHQQGLTVKLEMYTCLSKKAGKDIKQHTVEGYLAKINLKQRRNDLEDDWVTRGKHSSCILIFTSLLMGKQPIGQAVL